MPRLNTSAREELFLESTHWRRRWSTPAPRRTCNADVLLYVRPHGELPFSVALEPEVVKGTSTQLSRCCYAKAFWWSEGKEQMLGCAAEIFSGHYY